MKFFRENKRWQQCQYVYNRANESEVTMDLTTIMRAMLRPDDIQGKKMTEIHTFQCTNQPKNDYFFCKMTRPLQISLKYHQKKKNAFDGCSQNRNKAACEMQILWSFRILLLSLCLEENNILTSFNPNQEIMQRVQQKRVKLFFSNKNDNV